MDRAVVLVVDDEAAVRGALAELLGAAGHLVRTAENGRQALEMMQSGGFDAVLLDVVMPEMSGLEVLQAHRGAGGQLPVVVLSGLTGADDVVRALRLGATDYVNKPVRGEELTHAVARALGREVPAPVAPVEESLLVDPVEGRQLITISGAMRRAEAMVDRIADTDVPVLLLGESGTGKEVIAREIHNRSRRRGKPFIKVNCAALPADLLESELFGHERGAFTGATAEKPGKFELADGGTIFLDEIGEMAIRLQAKLLQVLQDEEFFRVGGKKSVRVDSRVVVATNRQLEREIALGNFREDLFYRLNVVAIRLAPLRERREDIVPLVDHFLKKYGKKYRNAVTELPPEVLKAFIGYEWPGNVRELENMVRRMVVLKDPGLVLEELRSGGRQPDSAPSLPTSYSNESGSAAPVVHAHAAASSGAGPAGASVTTYPQVLLEQPAPVPPAGANAMRGYPNPFLAPQPPPPAPTMAEADMSLKDIGKRAAMLAEREAILSMLHRTGWNKRKAATKLRISYKALLYKIKESGIIDPRANAEF